MLVAFKGLIGASVALFVYSFVTEYTVEQRASDHRQCLEAARGAAQQSEFFVEGAVAERRITSRHLMIWGQVRTGDSVEPATIRCVFDGRKLDLFYSAAGIISVTAE